MDILYIFLCACVPGAMVIGVYGAMMNPNWLDRLLEKPAEFIMRLADKLNERS